MKKQMIICASITAVITALVVSLIFIFVIIGMKNNAKTAEPTAAVETAAPLSPAIAVPSETAPLSTAAPAAGETSSDLRGETLADSSGSTSDDASSDASIAEPVHSPEEFDALVAQAGTSPQEMYAEGCSQMITVQSEGSYATVDFYTVSNNSWVRSESLHCSGYVGSNGVTLDMHEGGYASPWGLFSVGEAFYTVSKPETGLNTFRITEDTYWVDDPDSKYYNRRVEGTADKDWSSAEHMIDYSSYEYGFVINYNVEAAYGAGSAIFFHISDRPTAGCVGVSYEMVLAYLAALDASANPYILIL